MKTVIIIGVITIAALAVIVFAINLYVKLSTRKQIIKDENYDDLKDIDCIIVLGAGIWGDRPSHMLEDRLLESIKLYENHVSNKLLMSGDHGTADHDEVNLMKNYAKDRGVPSEDIFMDHAGFSTYDSMYRAKEIFQAKRVVIVTQEYHLYRALYIAKRLGLEAYGVGSDPRTYVNQHYREVREFLARDKDFFKCMIKPKPTYLGEPIPIDGNGDLTNDK